MLVEILEGVKSSKVLSRSGYPYLNKKTIELTKQSFVGLRREVHLAYYQK